MEDFDTPRAIALIDHPGQIDTVKQLLNNMQLTEHEVVTSLSTESAKTILSTQFDVFFYYFSQSSKLFHIRWLLLQLSKRTVRSPHFVLIQDHTTNQILSLLLEKNKPELLLSKSGCNAGALEKITELMEKREKLSDCYLALEQHNYIKTIEQGQETLADKSLTPTVRVECLRLIAYGYYHLGQLEKALATCDQALTEQNGLTWPYYLRGCIHLQNRDCNAADKEFQRALDIDPSYVIAADELSNSYLKQNRLKEAQKLLGQTVDISPANMERLESLGFIANLNDDPEAATAAMRRLNQIAEESHATLNSSQWLSFAKALCLQVDYDKTGHDAFKELTKLLENNLQLSDEQKDLHVRKSLLQGNFSARLKDQQSASKNYLQAEDLYDNHYHQFTGHSHVDIAQEFYESDHFIAKGDLILRELLWRYRHDSKLYDRIQLFFKSDPFLSTEANTIGIAFYKKKRYQTAVQLLDLAADMRPENSSIQLNAAQANIALFTKAHENKKNALS
ncbi:tetratricopeptide repeat protein [Piscirickettsia litoralis]|uniref:Tetratricopeptide repeat protein n=1 Tax=Piscirickettsia litoralis TaxID=1891921 RepID=A0ABX3A285_9GAMM|nr:tetratricopeptide repeat protein [Piscirickettsia litoralis]ODN42943.1 hypothetical protein BGC07_08440 [Piscirickettsia litoralis]